MNKEKEKRKISFFIGSMRRGGAERVISILANQYAKDGWDVDIITLLSDSNEYVLEEKIRVVPLCGQGSQRTFQIPRWLCKIRKYVKEDRPDRIVSFVTRINLVVLCSCLGLKKHIVVSERSDPSAPGRIPFYVMLAIKALYPLAHSVVFQTLWAKSYFSERIQSKGVILPNPIQVQTEASDHKEKKIVAVGRLLEVKNHAMLIRVFKRVHDVFPEYKLYIYGEGNLKADLTNQIEAAGLVDCAFLPGNVLDIHKRIADAELFVLSSNYEGFSNALLEAMMMGLTCISTDVAGSNEIIENGKNGLLVKTKDEEQLFEAVCSLISDKEKALRLGIEGKKSVQHIKVESIISKWKECIE